MNDLYDISIMQLEFPEPAARYDFPVHFYRNAAAEVQVPYEIGSGGDIFQCGLFAVDDYLQHPLLSPVQGTALAVEVDDHSFAGEMADEVRTAFPDDAPGMFEDLLHLPVVIVGVVVVEI